VRPSRIGADLRVVYRSYLRNPVALFFSLIFPLILIGLFGLIFSAIGTSSTPLYVLNEDNNSAISQGFLQALDHTGVVTVHTVNVSPSDFATWLGQNDYSAGLLIPHGFAANASSNTTTNLTVYVNPEDASVAGPVVGAIEGVESAFNLQAACPTPGACIPLLAYGVENVGSQTFTYIDYLIPGLIGFSILTSPMFSLVDIASSYRKEGLFRELSLTPLTRAEWLTSRIVWYLLLTFAAAGIMIGAGTYLFGAHVVLSLGLVPFLIVGPFFFVSLGMLAGSAAKTPESAALIGNIITFPMMFLSGTFFAVSSFPPYLQTVARFLPLYYVIDGMNQVMLFQNGTKALQDLLVVLVAAILVFVAAVRLFKWRDE
jgi:ABC-2 type transport system permease protein